MPVIAYSSLGRGLLSGKITSGNMADYAKLMDEPARKGYACEENFERLRRCETLAKEKGILVDWVNDDNSFWWLRSPGYSPYSAAIVYSNGLLYMYGSRINSTRAVRPVLWIRTD